MTTSEWVGAEKRDLGRGNEKGRRLLPCGWKVGTSKYVQVPQVNLRPSKITY